MEKACARSAAVNKVFVFISNQLKKEAEANKALEEWKKLQEQHKINKMKIQKLGMLRRLGALACVTHALQIL